MNKIDELRIINDSNMLYLKRLNLDYTRNTILKNILDDDACFFKMSKEDAYSVLKDLNIVDDELEKTYQELISNKEFNKLVSNGIINIDDKELVIYYPIYDEKDIFKDKTKINNENKNNIDIIQYNDSVLKKIIKRIKNFFRK